MILNEVLLLGGNGLYYQLHFVILYVWGFIPKASCLRPRKIKFYFCVPARPNICDFLRKTFISFFSIVVLSIQFVSAGLLFRLLKTTPLNDSIAIKTVSYDFRAKIFFIANRWYSKQIAYHRQTLPRGILLRNSIKKILKIKKKSARPPLFFRKPRTQN